MKTSYKEYFEFTGEAEKYLSENAEETKFNDALKSIVELKSDLAEKYNKALGKIQRRNAAEDPKTMVILRNERGGYEYTKSGEEKLEEEAEILFTSTENVEIDQEYVDKIPEGLPKGLQKKVSQFIIISKTV